ncbi:MAG: hypothetical protein ACKO7W_12260 [Elainella sp.]
MGENAATPDESRSVPLQIEQTVLQDVSVGGDLTIGNIDVSVIVPPPSPQTEPKRFTVPYLRNPYFTGRTAALEQVHAGVMVRSGV